MAAFLAFSFAITSDANAQAEKAKPPKYTYKNGIGVKFSPFAVTFKTFLGQRNRAFEALLDFDNGFRATVLYEFHGDLTAQRNLKWYVGFGGHGGYYDKNMDDGIYKKNGGKNFNITQTQSIDYEYGNWDADAVIPSKAESKWYEGTFKPIHNQPLVQGMSYDGNNNELRNFRIASGNDLGLFDYLENSHMQNMKLVNFDVRGGEFVGALAGKMDGGSITNCGVYLSTMDGYGRALEDMAARVEKYKIQGANHVGGMIGQTTNGKVDTINSFTAINVVGNSFVGGFCGKYRSGTITNSYSSGKVTVNGTHGGGFIGIIENGTEVKGC